MTLTPLSAIGNTPLVKLQKIVPKGCADIYVKLEYLNPTGSYKDRMALSIIEQAEQRGDLRPGMTVVECTGGSTGTSLSFICAVKGYAFTVVSSDAFAPEKLHTMKVFGANLLIEPSKGGVSTPDLVPRMLARAAKIASADDTFPTVQFENVDALIGYEGLGKELISQVPGKIDSFCACVGSGGMLMGVASVLFSAGFDTKIIAVEPKSSPFLTEGRTGPHSVDGVAPGFRPPLLQESLLDGALSVEESKARSMARQLARDEGIFAGTSTGMNVTAAIELAAELGPGKSVVTVACDSGMKYLAGNLFD